MKKFAADFYCKSFLFFLSAIIIFLSHIPASLSFDIDCIDIPEIREMQLREENGGYYMDVIIVVKNSGGRDIQLQNCDFSLAFAAEDIGKIELGKAVKDFVTLKSTGTVTDTELPLTVTLGNIEKLHLDIISSDEMNSLLTSHEPQLNLSVTGEFDAGVYSKMGWTYEQGIRIEWVLKTKIQRKVLMDAYKAIELAAKGKISPEQESRDEEFIFEEYKKSNP